MDGISVCIIIVPCITNMNYHYRKNVVYNYSEAEVKVREATSNDVWGPSAAVMREIAEYTFHV